MQKPMSKMLVCVGIFFLIVFGWYGVRKLIFLWFMTHYEPPPTTISATVAVSTTWQSYLTAIATLNAINGVDMTAEISGIVSEIRFTSGQFVKKGDVLMVLRSDVEQANLKSNQAKLSLAKINYDRDLTLFNKHVTSQAVLDSRYAELLQAQAGVELVEAQIRQKNITAPFDGKLGIRLINIGQYISPGTPMVTLQAMNPLHVDFTLPEQYLNKLYIGQPIDVTVNIGKGEVSHGTLTAINSKVDQVTRNLSIEATIPNNSMTLYPGMYGLAKIWLPEQKNTIVIPQTAVSYSLSGDYVFLIKQENSDKKEKVLKVYRQYVKVGERRGDRVSIVVGLKAGDQIVTSGQLKLQNGTRVLIDNSVEL